jgi:hypothetical protein
MKRTANHNEWWPRAERREALGNAIACTRRAGAEPDPELRADLQRVVDGTMTLEQARRRSLARFSNTPSRRQK